MGKEITQSQFHVWRTLCAIAHADNIFRDEELRFIAGALDSIALSDEQTTDLKDDVANAKNYNEMFEGVTNKRDRAEFFKLARGLVWADGEYAAEEKSAMLELQQAHIHRTDVDSIIGEVSLEFEDDNNHNLLEQDKKSRFKSIINLFKEHYFDKL